MPDPSGSETVTPVSDVPAPLATPGAPVETTRAADFDAAARAFAYLVWFVSGALLLALSRTNRDLRFHARQSLLYSAVVVVWLGICLGFGLPRWSWVGFAVYTVTVPALLVVWLIVMVKAYQGVRVRLPIIGALAERS